MIRIPTKTFYRDKAWEAIISHPKFTLGRREIESLVRFLPAVAAAMPARVNILHLGIGNGREIECFVEAFPKMATYVVNDICPPVLERVVDGAREAFPNVAFTAAHGDIESPGAIAGLRAALDGPTLFVLVANSVIFSNRALDAQLRAAMRPEDRFMVTLELPNPGMMESYTIEPVYGLLSGSGTQVTPENSRAWYDEGDQCLKMACGDRLLLAAYKPRREELVSRMSAEGMEAALLECHDDISMIAGLFRAR
jgi:hypothetical protein